MEYKFSCADNTDISLHDCRISNIEWGKDIILTFDGGFNVTFDNPQNDTGRHKQTGSAAVVLYNGKFHKAFFHECISRHGELETTIPQTDMTKEDLILYQVEVLEHEYDAASRLYKLSGFVWYKDVHKAHVSPYCDVVFVCDEVRYCWNEFVRDAWFQND